MTRRRWLLIVGLLACLVGPSSLDAQSGFRHVNAGDPTCGGHAPCYASIQAAVTAATAGEHVVVQAGTYHEQVAITGKNNTASATEADRIVIEADPAAEVGSVVLQGAVTQCTNGFAIRLQQSKFITIRGLTITGAGGQAISLLGGNNQNRAIHLERLRIVGNGSGSCDGGITIARGNPGTLLLNSLIYANGRNGFSTIDADGGPHYLIGNTIHGNQWSGVSITRSHEAYLINNAITGNGTAAGSTGGRFGVTRESSTTPNPAGIHLLNNLICGNRLGEINGPALDGTDSGNLTPTGSEGAGVTARAGCNVPANVYAHVAGVDGVANTADDDFTPSTSSPLLDAGLDPRTLGLAPAFNPLLEADYLQPAARPGLGTAGGTARFDIGARELDVADDIAPLVTILAPPADSYVRLQVPVAGQATDDGSGVATFTLRIGTQLLTTTLTPSIPPPAPAVTANATWDTTAFADGTYTLTAEAEDAAGNPGSATRVLIVDNTPPDTTIVDGPAATTSATTVTFVFTGSDNLTPSGSLLFSWRADNGSFSNFSAGTSVTLTNLTPGSHLFQVKARDLAGNEDPTPAESVFTVANGPAITITSPSAGAAVPEGVLIVRGTVDGNGQDVAVSVNGSPAAVEGSVFAVQVPVSPGTVSLAAIAVGSNGATGLHAIDVSVFGTSAGARATSLVVAPGNGIAPFTARFSVSGTAVATVTMDFEGDGIPDFTGPSLNDQFFTYTVPGIYFPTAVIDDGQGTQTTISSVVFVESAASANTRFQNLWNGLRGRLAAGDIQGALAYLSPDIQPRFAAVFQNLAPNLQSIAAGLETPVIVEQIDDMAETVIVRQRGSTPFLFFIYFRRDGLGRWFIEEM